jgi:hypothetical protein
VARLNFSFVLVAALGLGFVGFLEGVVHGGGGRGAFDGFGVQ